MALLLFSAAALAQGHTLLDNSKMFFLQANQVVGFYEKDVMNNQIPHKSRVSYQKVHPDDTMKTERFDCVSIIIQELTEI